MIAQKKNLSIDKGAVFEQLFRYRNADTTGVDLTGWTGMFYIIERNTDGFSQVVNCDLSEINGELGWIQVRIGDTMTAVLDSKTKAYSLELRDPAGDIYRLLYGQLIVRDRSVV